MAQPLIFIGLGANLASPRYGAPKATLSAALEKLEAAGVHVTARSRWYQSAAMPPSDQPDYVNAVVSVETRLAAAPLLAALHRIEAALGRVRGAANAARIVDLDLLAYGNTVSHEPTGPRLPHPRLHERAFVLLPLREIAPRWYHPFLGRTVDQMIAALPADQEARPLA